MLEFITHVTNMENQSLGKKSRPFNTQQFIINDQRIIFQLVN